MVETVAEANPADQALINCIRSEVDFYNETSIRVRLICNVRCVIISLLRYAQSGFNELIGNIMETRQRGNNNEIRFKRLRARITYCTQLTAYRNTNMTW